MKAHSDGNELIIIWSDQRRLMRAIANVIPLIVKQPNCEPASVADQRFRRLMDMGCDPDLSLFHQLADRPVTDPQLVSEALQSLLRLMNIEVHLLLSGNKWTFHNFAALSQPLVRFLDEFDKLPTSAIWFLLFDQGQMPQRATQ